MLPSFVLWWCDLVGVTEPTQRNIAVGAFAALSVAMVAYSALVIVLAVLTSASRSGRGY